MQLWALSVRAALAQANELNFVIGSAQTLHQPGERQGNSVHLRWIGFRDNGYAQGPAARWEIIYPEVSEIEMAHSRMIRETRNRFVTDLFFVMKHRCHAIFILTL